MVFLLVCLFLVNFFSGRGGLGAGGEGGPGAGGAGGGGLGTEPDTGEAGEANLSCCCFNTADSKSGLTTDNWQIGELTPIAKVPMVLLVTTQTTDLPSKHSEMA